MSSRSPTPSSTHDLDDRVVDDMKEEEEERHRDDLRENASCVSLEDFTCLATSTPTSLLRKADRCAHVLLQKHIENQDGGLLKEVIAILESIGSPKEVEDALSSLKGTAGKSSSSPLYDALQKEASTGKTSELIFCHPSVPTKSSASILLWDEAAENIYFVCRVLSRLISKKDQLAYKVPHSLQTRLIPLLYAWAVDWEFLCRFPEVWHTVAQSLCLVIPTPHLCFGSTPPVVLPWKPLLKLVWSLGDPVLKMHANLSRFAGIQRCTKDVLSELCIKCASCFEPNAVKSLWDVCAPYASAHTTECGANLHIFSLFCPLFSRTERERGMQNVATSEPIEDLCRYIFTEYINENLTAMRVHVALNLIGSIAMANPGLLKLNQYAEPFFTLSFRALQLSNPSGSGTEPRNGTGSWSSVLPLEMKTENVAKSISRVVYLLPHQTTSPLWNQLRRFIHATRVFLRPHMLFNEDAKSVEALYSGMVESARSRVEKQKSLLHDSSPGLTISTFSLESSKDCGIPEDHIWTNETVNAFVEIIEEGVFISLECDGKHNIEMVAELVRLAPEKLMNSVFSKVTAAFEHKTQDMKRQVKALKLLQKCVYPCLCVSSETTEALLTFTQEQILPRASAWMKAENSVVSQAMLLFFWTLSTTIKFNRLFSAVEECVFASELAEHVVTMTTSRKMSTRWFTTLRSIFFSCSNEAFEVLAKKILNAAKMGRGTQLHSLLLPLGLRDPSRIMEFARTNAIPVLLEHHSSDEDITWACTVLEKCVACGSREDLFNIAPKVVECIHIQFGNLTNPNRLKEAKLLYGALFQGLMNPRCLERDGEVSFHPIRGQNDPNLSHFRKMNFCASEEVQLTWDVPDREHIVFMRDFMDQVLDDIFYVAEHLEDLQVEESNPLRRLREIVVLGSGKNKVKQAGGKKENTTDSKTHGGSLMSASIRELSIPDVINGLCSVLSAVIVINGVFYHVKSPSLDCGSRSSTPADITEKMTLNGNEYSVPLLHWGYQKRCCSLSIYLESIDQGQTNPRYSLNHIFDLVKSRFLPLVSKESIPVAEMAFGEVLNEFIGVSGKDKPIGDVEPEESARALGSTLTVMATFCNLMPTKSSKISTGDVSAEKDLYLRCYAGRRPFSTPYFPQSFWPLRAVSVFQALEGSFTFSLSISRRQELLWILFRFLFSTTPSISESCQERLFSLTNQIAAPFRRKILAKAAVLMEAVATKWLYNQNKDAVDVFKRLLSEETSALECNPGESESCRSVLVGTADGTSSNTEEENPSLKYSSQVVSSMLSLMSNWFARLRKFSFDDSLLRVVRLLLAFPMDLCSRSARITIFKSIQKMPFGAIHDYDEVWEGIKQLISIGYRYAFIKPSSGAQVLYIAASYIKPWIGMKVEEPMLHHLAVMCTNTCTDLQKQARFILSAALLSTSASDAVAEVIPLRDGDLELTPSAKAIEVFRERYDYLRVNFSYGVIESVGRFMPRAVRIVSFGDAERHKHLAQRIMPPGVSPISPELEDLWCGYRFIRSTNTAHSQQCDEVRQSLEKLVLPQDVTPELIKETWVWTFIQNTKLTEKIQDLQVSIWSSVSKIIGLERSVPFFVKAIQMTLDELSRVFESSPGKSNGAEETVLEMQDRFQVVLLMTFGLLRATKEHPSSLVRRQVLDCLQHTLRVAFSINAQQKMVDVFNAGIQQQRLNLSEAEVWELYDSLFGMLDHGEKKSVSGQGDDRQSRWVSNVLLSIETIFSTFTNEYNEELLDRFLVRLRSVHNTVWYGRTPLWRSRAAGLVNAVMRFPDREMLLLRSNEGMTQKVIQYYTDTMNCIQFPSVHAAEEDQEDSPVNNTRRLSMIKTFAASCVMPCPAVVAELYASLTKIFVQSFEISLPEVDVFSTIVSLALKNLALAPLPKQVVHEMLETWCNMVLKKTDGHGAVMTLSRRAASELTQAIQILIFTNLHRIGKFSMMQLVGEVSLEALASTNSAYRSSGQFLFGILTRVASVEQVSSLVGMYEEELKKMASMNPKPLRRTALVLALCMAVLADTSGVPKYVPRLMRRLVPYAADEVMDVQRETKQMFERWWHTHRDVWDTEVKQHFTAAQIDAMTPLLKAPRYFA